MCQSLYYKLILLFKIFIKLSIFFNYLLRKSIRVNTDIIMKEINNKSFQQYYFIKFTNNKSIDKITF